MNPGQLSIKWTDRAKRDVREIYFSLLEKNSEETSRKIINEIIGSPETIIFPEQYQFDEYLTHCRRIILRNYKILYFSNGLSITVITIFNTYHNPVKMKR